jgi:anti-anti-sigma regulatory factor
MPPATAVPVCVADDGQTLILRVGFRLDGPAADALVEAATAAVSTGAERVDIDLRSLQFFTTEGAAALVTCRDVCGALPGGLHYRTGRGPGREALLAAYSDHALD